MQPMRQLMQPMQPMQLRLSLLAPPCPCPQGPGVLHGALHQQLPPLHEHPPQHEQLLQPPQREQPPHSPAPHPYPPQQQWQQQQAPGGTPEEPFDILADDQGPDPSSGGRGGGGAGGTAVRGGPGAPAGGIKRGREAGKKVARQKPKTVIDYGLDFDDLNGPEPDLTKRV